MTFGEVTLNFGFFREIFRTVHVLFFGTFCFENHDTKVTWNAMQFECGFRMDSESHSQSVFPLVDSAPKFCIISW